ncbi:hypothetical protein KC342_g18309 [Hortaea werneckii]|nr:hypothetical protein KC342_g18309 [Hortaea werneckii]KAI7372253.1 hypothetical protein KC328_g17374 [Hortaea werneckii]
MTQTRSRTARRAYLDALQAPLRDTGDAADSRPSSSGSSSHQVLLKWKPEGTWRGVLRRGAAIPREAYGLGESSDSGQDRSAQDTRPRTSSGAKRKRPIEDTGEARPPQRRERSTPPPPQDPTPSRPSQVEVAATQVPKAVHEQAAAWLAEALPQSTDRTRGTMLQGRDDWDADFVRIWDFARQRKVAGQLEHPLDRLISADLYERYEELQSDTRGRGRPARVVAKETMFEWLYGEKPHRGRRWDEFGRTIKYGRRWREVTQALGRGVVALFPTALTANWINQTLLNGELTAWLAAVRAFHPHVVGLAESVEPLLAQATAGEAPPPFTLGIERWTGTKAALQELGTGWFTVAPAIPQTPPGSNTGLREPEDDWREGFDEEDWWDLIAP